MANSSTLVFIAIFSTLALKALSQDLSLLDAFDDDVKTVTKAPVKPTPMPGGQLSDLDLDNIANNGDYVPDKGKGGQGDAVSSTDDGNQDSTAETGTIAGIVSALAMALMGTVGGYISYQKKRLCFSVQRKRPKKLEIKTRLKTKDGNIF